MQNLKSYFCSSVGRKQIIAVTGLVWCGFVLSHMAGNCLLFIGPDAYNHYSHALISNPAIELAEAFLAVTLVIHLSLATQMAFASRVARATPPDQSPTHCLKAASFASRTMILTGLLVLFFIVWHLITFKYGPNYTTTVNGVVMRDIYKLVAETFQNPLYVFSYLGFLIVLGLHLSHGASALLQTLGVGSIRNKLFKQAGYVFAALIFLGFASQPFYFFIRGEN